MMLLQESTNVNTSMDVVQKMNISMDVVQGGRVVNKSMISNVVTVSRIEFHNLLFLK